MSEIFVSGLGAVSPAGWGLVRLREALARREPIAPVELTQPNWPHSLRVRPVPTPSPRPAFLVHARLRRTSPIAQYAVAAAIEALGQDAVKISAGSLRLGLVLCVMSGCVNYSRRFYDEVLKDPNTASPLVFPETVFNAPASHIGALLGATSVNYTLVGDPGTFLQGIALAADWLLSDEVDGCLVVGAEELDWLTTEAFRLFSRQTIVSEGAGALYLRRDTTSDSAIQISGITQPQSFSKTQTRLEAVRQVRAELGNYGENCLLCDGLQGIARADSDEEAVWSDWTGPRLSPKILLGEGSMAGAAWQCVAAVDSLTRGEHSAAVVTVVGCNQQAIAARFVKLSGPAISSLS